MLAADNTRNRGKVNDRPAAIGDHGRDRVLDAKEHPGGVNRHDPMPGFGAVEVLFGAARDAGIVDQHVELAEMAGSGSHDGGPTPFLGDIERFEPRRDTNTIRYLPTFVLQYIGNHHFGALACEHARRGGSHAYAAPEMMATLPASLIVVLPSLSGAQRPVNFGRRFSAKADTASWWSLVRFDCVSRLRLRSTIEWAS